jgi:hypothetical protein
MRRKLVATLAATIAAAALAAPALAQHHPGKSGSAIIARSGSAIVAAKF